MEKRNIYRILMPFCSIVLFAVIFLTACSGKDGVEQTECTETPEQKSDQVAMEDSLPMPDGEYTIPGVGVFHFKSNVVVSFTAEDPNYAPENPPKIVYYETYSKAFLAMQDLKKEGIRCVAVLETYDANGTEVFALVYVEKGDPCFYDVNNF